VDLKVLVHGPNASYVTEALKTSNIKTILFVLRTIGTEKGR
jgi:hypothetical protein